jgi:hypothetical protein
MFINFATKTKNLSKSVQNHIDFINKELGEFGVVSVLFLNFKQLILILS